MLSLFQFFFKCFIRSRRMFWMGLLGMIPVFYVLLVYALKVFMLGDDFSVSGLFPKLAFSMYLHFLLPLMAVFIGTSVIVDEVESYTLPYLLVRPIPRWQIILSKLLASNVLLALILSLSLSVVYGLMSINGGMGDVCGFDEFISAILVLIGGSFAYVSFFCLLGGAIRKPVLMGLFFSFGWEKMVGSLPGSLRFSTLMYYLNSLFPFKEKSGTSGLFSLLRSTLTTLPAWKAVLVLIALIGILHFVSISLLSWKEYVHQED